MCWKANAKVAIPHVLHLSPLGHGLWNCGEHHVERVEVEQVPWCVHGCLVHRVHRLLRAHRKISAWRFENEWLDPTRGIEGSSYSIKEGRKIYRSRCRSNSEPLLPTAFYLSRQCVQLSLYGAAQWLTKVEAFIWRFKCILHFQNLMNPNALYSQALSTGLPSHLSMPWTILMVLSSQHFQHKEIYIYIYDTI